MILKEIPPPFNFKDLKRGVLINWNNSNKWIVVVGPATTPKYADRCITGRVIKTDGFWYEIGKIGEWSGTSEYAKAYYPHNISKYEI